MEAAREAPIAGSEGAVPEKGAALCESTPVKEAARCGSGPVRGATLCGSTREALNAGGNPLDGAI